MVLAWERPSGHTTVWCGQLQTVPPPEPLVLCPDPQYTVTLLLGWKWPGGEHTGIIGAGMGTAEGVVLMSAAHPSWCQLGTVLRAGRTLWECL